MRSTKDRTEYDKQTIKEREEASERNEIEGVFGTGKRRLSLNRIITRLQGASKTQIHLTFVVMNLGEILRDLFAQFFRITFQHQKM